MRILSLSLLLTLAACSVEDNNSSQTSAEATAVTEATLNSLVGTYAMTIALQGSADYPAPVGKVNTVTSSYRLANISLNEGKLEILEANCAGDISSDSTFKLSSHKKVQQSANPIAAELAVELIGGKVSITRPLAVQVVGAELRDIETEALPTDANDERLIVFKNFNSKKDELEKFRGAKSSASFTTPKVLFIPGITITSDIYFATRSTNTYSAVLDSKGDLKGQLSDTTEQSVVSVTNVIAAGAKGQAINVTPKEKGSVSFVRLKEGAAATCETVIKKLAPAQADKI